jgi:hypothetical protein
VSGDQSNYRVYCHDGARKVVSAEWVAAANDEDAVTVVEAMYPGLHCEIWDGNRLVAKLEAKRDSA